MSLIENIASRGRGRPPKFKELEGADIDLTPVERALAKPLPSEITAIVKQLSEAAAAVEAAFSVYDETKKASEHSFERQVKEARYAVESAERAVEGDEQALKDARVVLSGARLQVENLEGTAFKGRVYPGSTLAFNDELNVAKAEFEKAEARVAELQEAVAASRARRAFASSAEAALEKTPEAVAFEAWQKALSQLDIAGQLGDYPGAPTAEEVDQLKAAYDAARLETARPFEPKLQVLKEEIARRVAVRDDLYHKALSALAPFATAWRAAADEQLAKAANLIAQTQQLESLLKQDGDVFESDCFTYPRVSGDGDHTGNSHTRGADSMRSIYQELASIHKKSDRRI